MSARPVPGDAAGSLQEPRASQGRGHTAQAALDSGDRRLLRVPGLAADAVRLCWAASPRSVIVTVGLQAAAGAGVAVQLLIAQRILTDLVAVDQGADSSALVADFGLLVAITVAMGAITALVSQHQQLLVELVGQYSFGRIVEIATSVRLSSLETPEFHDQLSRARTSGLSRGVTLVTSLTTLSTALVTSIGIAVVLFVLQPLLLAFVAVAAVPLMIATLYNSRASHAFQYAMTPESRERLYLTELLTGREAAKELRAFDAAGFFRSRYDALTADRLRRYRAFLRRRLRISLGGTAATALGTAVAFGALCFLLVDGRIDVATAATAGVAMQQLSGRMGALTSSIGQLVESAMFVEDYKRFLELADDHVTTGAATAAPAASVPHPVAGPELAVEHVSFAYPGTTNLVLDDVSLEVRRGEIVALVGQNGSGKTTLVKLICQLYELERGLVRWRGVDASTLPPEDVRRDVTVLFQDFIKYHLTAEENILVGRPDGEPDRAAMEAAARRAGADGFVTRLPSGYGTRLGREFYGGHELSVGQWQRLALARAFYRGGDFVILDEPTASLDPRAEHELFLQIGELLAGRSVLLISHRFSSVRSADRIYVMDAGRIIESGSHDDLMSREGHYAELFRLQAAAYLGEAPPA